MYSGSGVFSKSILSVLMTDESGSGARKLSGISTGIEVYDVLTTLGAIEEGDKEKSSRAFLRMDDIVTTERF